MAFLIDIESIIINYADIILEEYAESIISCLDEKNILLIRDTTSSVAEKKLSKLGSKKSIIYSSTSDEKVDEYILPNRKWYHISKSGRKINRKQCEDASKGKCLYTLLLEIYEEDRVDTCIKECIERNWNENMFFALLSWNIRTRMENIGQDQLQRMISDYYVSDIGRKIQRLVQCPEAQYNNFDKSLRDHEKYIIYKDVFKYTISRIGSRMADIVTSLQFSDGTPEVYYPPENIKDAQPLLPLPEEQFFVDYNKRKFKKKAYKATLYEFKGEEDVIGAKTSIARKDLVEIFDSISGNTIFAMGGPDECHWSYKDIEGSIHDPYIYKMQDAGSHQFCQTHALHLALDKDSRNPNWTSQSAYCWLLKIFKKIFNEEADILYNPEKEYKSKFVKMSEDTARLLEQKGLVKSSGADFFNIVLETLSSYYAVLQNS